MALNFEQFHSSLESWEKSRIRKEQNTEVWWGETSRQKREGSCFEVLGGSCLNSSILEETETDYTLYIDENLLRDLGVPLSWDRVLQ